uniref:Uncharacterized protein n=1 Tax=Romanomermis culicivorax TaxID=13658 RepID=A0A915I7S1_ROMCU
DELIRQHFNLSATARICTSSGYVYGYSIVDKSCIDETVRDVKDSAKEWSNLKSSTKKVTHDQKKWASATSGGSRPPAIPETLAIYKYALFTLIFPIYDDPNDTRFLEFCRKTCDSP